MWYLALNFLFKLQKMQRAIVEQNISLLARNEEMAKEISKLKSLNINLKKLLSKLLKQDLNRSKRLKDKETQTIQEDFIQEKVISPQAKPSRLRRSSIISETTSNIKLKTNLKDAIRESLSSPSNSVQLEPNDDVSPTRNNSFITPMYWSSPFLTSPEAKKTKTKTKNNINNLTETYASPSPRPESKKDPFVMVQALSPLLTPVPSWLSLSNRTRRQSIESILPSPIPMQSNTYRTMCYYK